MASYFQLLPARCHLLAQNYFDPCYYNIWCKLPGFDFLISNYRYDEMLFRAIIDGYDRIAIWILTTLIEFKLDHAIMKRVLDSVIEHKRTSLLLWLYRTDQTINLNHLCNKLPADENVVALIQQMQHDQRSVISLMPLLVRAKQPKLVPKDHFVGRKKHLLLLAAIDSSDRVTFNYVVTKLLKCNFGATLPQLLPFDLIDKIVAAGQIDLLSLVLSRYGDSCPVSNNSLITALKLRPKSTAIAEAIIAKLLAYGAEWTYDLRTRKAMAAAGAIELLQQCKIERKADNWSLIKVAVEHGQLAVVQLYWPNIRIDSVQLEHCMEIAIDHSQMELVIFLHRSGAALKSKYFDAALKNNCLPLLQWLQQHSCPVNERLDAFDFDKATPEIMDWAIEHYDDKISAIDTQDDPQFLVDGYFGYWLFEHNFINSSRCDVGVFQQLAQRNVAMAQFFGENIQHDNGYILRRFIEVGDIKSFLWLYRQDKTRYNKFLAVTAVVCGRLQIAQLLEEHLNRNRLGDLITRARKNYALNTAAWLQQKLTQSDQANKRQRIE